MNQERSKWSLYVFAGLVIIIIVTTTYIFILGKQLREANRPQPTVPSTQAPVAVDVSTVDQDLEKELTSYDTDSQDLTEIDSNSLLGNFDLDLSGLSF